MKEKINCFLLGLFSICKNWSW